MFPVVTISARGDERLRSGHPWIYRADVIDAQAAAGDRVLVRGPRGRTLGHALFSDRSQISLRMLAYGDQRENRAAAALYARGRVLDCFSYNGGFALRLARSAHETIALDISEEAIARVRQNAQRNGVAVDARVGNVFDELRGLERLRERFDTIVLDPPAFAKNKAAVANARAGYKEINLRALKLLNVGGTLVTCSCSYNVSEAMFAEIVYDAAVDAEAHVTVVEKRMQGRDHPVLLGVPETYYLKCFILRKLA